MDSPIDGILLPQELGNQQKTRCTQTEGLQLGAYFKTSIRVGTSPVQSACQDCWSNSWHQFGYNCRGELCESRSNQRLPRLALETAIEMRTWSNRFDTMSPRWLRRTCTRWQQKRRRRGSELQSRSSHSCWAQMIEKPRQLQQHEQQQRFTGLKKQETVAAFAALYKYRRMERKPLVKASRI